MAPLCFQVLCECTHFNKMHSDRSPLAGTTTVTSQHTFCSYKLHNMTEILVIYSCKSFYVVILFTASFIIEVCFTQEGPSLYIYMIYLETCSSKMKYSPLKKSLPAEYTFKKF